MQKKPDAVSYSTKFPNLCIFHCEQPLFAAREIAEHLDYVQHGSLRKQTLTDWQPDFVSMQDYFLYTTEMAIRPYERQYEKITGRSLTPAKPERGRLFFTVRGLLKVFDRTTKDHKELLKALQKIGIITPQDLSKHTEPPKAKKLPQKKVRVFSPPPPSVDAAVKAAITPAPDPAPVTQKQRQFEYEVLQKLLRQLSNPSYQEPTLRRLAVYAAETALGRSLQDVVDTSAEPVKAVKQEEQGVILPPKAQTRRAPAPQSARPPVGPYFELDEYYSLSRIGEKAGGYSSVNAGKAADIVGAKLGYTREDLRTKSLPINEIKLRPDTTTGKKRQMVRFNKKFANAVVLELRKNNLFQPMRPKTPTGVRSIV